jgi:hypothetical protein
MTAPNTKAAALRAALHPPPDLKPQKLEKLPLLMSQKQACICLGIHRTQFYLYVQAGLIAPTDLPGRNGGVCRRYEYEELRRFVEAQKKRKRTRR